MRKWKLLLAGMILTLSLSALTGCGDKTANDKNNGTDGMTTNTENRLDNNTDKTAGNNKNDSSVDTTENRTDKNDGNVVEDVVDGVGGAGKDVIGGVEQGVDDLTGNTDNQNQTNGNTTVNP